MTQMIAAVPIQLVDLALRVLALAAVAGIVLAVFRVKATALRLVTWKGVLYAALAMPVLAWMLPPLPVPVSGLVQNRASDTSAQTIVGDPQFSVGTSEFVLSTNEAIPIRETQDNLAPKENATTVGPSTAPAQSAPIASDSTVISFAALARGIYFVVALVLLARMIIGLIFSLRLVRTSAKISAPRVTARFASRQDTPVTEVVESSLVSVPVTVGIARPKVVLPANWREWDDAKLDAVVAHELSHVTRRDPLTQFLSLLHRAIFWFSPLAWWLDRHLAYLAEQASDEAALSSGANRNDYARVLLGFFEVLHTSPGRVWWQGVSMAKVGQAEKRLERILSWKGKVSMSLKKSVVVALFALAIPAVYLTASVRAANPQDAQDQTAPSVPQPSPAPSTGEIPAPAPSAAASLAPAAVAPVVAPVAAIDPPLPPAAWPVQNYSYGSGHGYSSGNGYSYAFGYDDEQRFVIVTGNSDSMTMSGTGEDARHVEKLKKQIPGDFIWFSRDEKSYIIRDQATVARARSFWAPQEEFGKQQEELGKKQEELGRQQEALGQKQEEVRVKVPDMTAELDRLKAKLQKLGPTATVEQIGDLQSEIGDLQSKIGDIQSEAGEQQGKLGEEQGALGEKQGKLGEEQGKLGEQQAKLAQKATQEMKALFDEALKNGKAQPEPQSGGGTGTL
ncbi:MAG TPA: M56 family metallopeptidase [Candidatus Sulfotelmatobacter sp.]|nr:M56 family metallopeptidase [Candidatus Sulfotelmatobacter sp.]